jgi:hypothetical protein
MVEDNMTMNAVRHGFVPEPGNLAIDLLQTFPEFSSMFKVEGIRGSLDVVRLDDMEIDPSVDAETRNFLTEVSELMDIAFARMSPWDRRLRTSLSNGPHWIWHYMLSRRDLGDRLGSIFAKYLVPPLKNV